MQIAFLKNLIESSDQLAIRLNKRFPNNTSSFWFIQQESEEK